ncbi:unnamed protein product [Strongylus vulgaris]|uniref:Uncharacterized protein n=1 Tax=Strongylus vulgaris TaxID=40348 RepID=A0A3P7J6U3_STRVU|nr:unnamed protein product [Strongylus vulgaris]
MCDEKSWIPFLIFTGAAYGPYAPRLGPYRSEGQHHSSHSHDHHSHGAPFQQLDWTTLQALPEPDRYLSALGVETYPGKFTSILLSDSAAGALVSNARPGWEGGQLISDSLPCLSPGIQITATAWKTQTASAAEQPKLQAEIFLLELLH